MHCVLVFVESLHTLVAKNLWPSLTLTETIILYGWHQERGSNTWIALNYSLIIAKYHIFSTSVRGGILDFENFLFRLKDKISTLHAITTKNNKIHKFKETWSPLL